MIQQGRVNNNTSWTRGKKPSSIVVIVVFPKTSSAVPLRPKRILAVLILRNQPFDRSVDPTEQPSSSLQQTNKLNIFFVIMVKAPSLSSKPAHGLDKKYKKFRRKQSKNASSSGSLKQQLRGQERLLLKLQQQSNDNDNDKTRISQIQDRIQQLTQQMAERQRTDRTKQYAKDSHGTRFLERQKLTRLESKARNEHKTSNLLAVALDLVYVAHYYPVIDQKYLPLLRHGERRVDDNKRLIKRAAIRGRILKALATIDRVKWIAADLYDMLPSEWTVDDEQRVFGCQAEDGATKKAAALLEDNRFTVKPQQDAILQAALELENTLDDDEQVLAARNSDEESSQTSNDHSGLDDSEDDADPLNDAKSSGTTTPSGAPVSAISKASKGNRAHQEDDDANDDSDSESSDAESDKEKNGDQHDDDDSSSSASSSNSSSVDDKSNKVLNETPPPIITSHKGDDEDDFLVAADDEQDAAKAFEKPKMYVPGLDQSRGDKSKGWETQRQRPGQFKKRRVRR